MKACIDPNSIDPWQLQAYADGERDPAVVHHLSECTYCAAQVDELIGLDSALAAQLFRLQCPPGETLLAYAWRLLPDNEADSVLDHLSSCPHCQEEIAEYFPAERVVHFPRLADPEGAATQRPSFRRQFQTFIAQLRPPQFELAPVRNAGDEQHRMDAPLLFDIDALDWSISIERLPQPNHTLSIYGQLLGPTTQQRSNFVVILHQPSGEDSGTPVDSTQINESGVFQFNELAPGEYILYLESQQDSIQIQTTAFRLE